MDEALRVSTGSRGLVSGYVWKLIRESAGMTQFVFAEHLGIDVATVQGWESGRRPLTAVRSGDLARFRIHLTRRGAAPKLFAVLNDALEADILIDHAVQAGPIPGSADRHPLAATVHRRDLTNLVTWPFNGVVPTQLRDLVPSHTRRRGPSPSRPVIPANARSRFFDHLIAIADQHRSGRETLLRRQSVYLLSFDTTTRTRGWLRDEYRRVVRSSRLDDPAGWVAVRSAAIALTRYGEKDPLLSFVAAGLRNHSHEVANLNYWAYWLGEITDIYIDDTFMGLEGLIHWDGSHLLAHLINRIGPDAEQLELNVRTLWQLLLARPHLLAEHPDLRTSVAARARATLDHGDLGKQVHQELSDVVYAVKLSRR